MRINSNIQALIANNVLKTNEEKNAASTEKMSSGYKLNHAKDAPAGMAISNKMHAQIMSLKKACDNASHAVNVVQTADGALSEVHSMLQRLNELAVKASNGTNTSDDREAIQKESAQLIKEINRVAADTEYNTQNLLGGMQGMKGYSDNDNVEVLDYGDTFPKGDYKLDITGDTATLVNADGTGVTNLKGDTKVEQRFDEDGNVTGGLVTATLNDGTQIKFSYKGESASANIDVTGIGGMKIQVGGSTGQEIRMVIPSIDADTIGVGDIDLSTQEGAKHALDSIKGAIDYVSSARAQLGAYQNRLESTIDSLDMSVENLTKSYSTIKDIDMAEEMVNFTTMQVLVQAGTSMLTQANEQPQQALQLLQ